MRLPRVLSSIAGVLLVAALVLPGIVAVPGERKSVEPPVFPGATGDIVPAALSKTPFFPPLPDVEGVSVLLFDVTTGEVLYERAGATPWPPASLTKLFTMYTVLDSVSAGEFSLDTLYPVPPGAYAGNMEPGSSLMFLGPGQVVSGDQLLYGLSVSSGNDAAFAVATLVAGSVDAFMEKVALDVRALGLAATSLVEPSGISAANVTTAGDLTLLARALILRWPEETRTYLSRQEFAYPQPENRGNGGMPPVTQRNRNSLLWDYAGADGMKTGYIDESGYNIVATAERDGRRLVAVVLGIWAESHSEGGAARSAAAAALLNWGFDQFAAVPLSLPADRLVTVLGSDESVPVRAVRVPVVALTPAGRGALRGEIEITPALWAPVAAGTPVGRARYLVNGEEILDVALVTGEGVVAAHPWPRFRDRYRFRVASLFDDRRGEAALAQ